MSSMSFGRVKVKEDLWTLELALSTCIFLSCVVGTIIGIFGLVAIPKCRYGEPKCYLFVKVFNRILASPQIYSVLVSNFLFITLYLTAPITHAKTAKASRINQ